MEQKGHAIRNSDNKPQADIRRRKLVRLLRENENLSTVEVAHHFGVNPMTIRRDLKILEAEGRVLRCYGGAVVKQRVTLEFAYDEHHQHNLDLKARIGAAAASRIQAGQTIYLDTGTTSLEVAKALAEREVHCTVVTCNLVVASTLWGLEAIELLLVGGRVRRGSPDLVGPATEYLIDRMTIDIAFFGADGIDLRRGTYAHDLEVVQVAECVINRTRQLIIVADHTKLGMEGKVRCFDFTKINEIITNNEAPPESILALKQMGVHVTHV